MTTTHPDDEREIRNLVTRFQTAWNASDSAAYAATMTQDADFISVLGERYHGREIVERGHRHIFDTIYKDSRLFCTVEAIRFVRSDVALALLHQKLISRLPPNVITSTARQRQMSDDMHESQMRASLVLTKDRTGHWHIAAVHNTIVASVVTAHV